MKKKKPTDKSSICLECSQKFLKRWLAQICCSAKCSEVAKMRRDLSVAAYDKKILEEKLSQARKGSYKKQIIKKVLRKPHPFYDSKEWQALRYLILKSHILKYGKKCLLCGNSKKPLHVDHIKPRSKYPKLELDYRNLQVLCSDCNIGKSNKDETDWR